MSDIFPSGEQGDLALVNSINPEGYVLDPVPMEIADKLSKHTNPRFHELGDFFVQQNRFGHGAEYSGRLARARETSGVSNTTFETTIREKLNWEPGEVINLNELMQQIAQDEEIQISDYRGRSYQMVRGANNFRLIGAYDQKSQPMMAKDGSRLEGKEVSLSKFTTASDEKLAQFGVAVEPYVRLVDPGQVTEHTAHGEEYMERKNGRVSQVAASRLLMTFPDGTNGFGMLVSTMKLIPKDIKEGERLSATQWRLRDSSRTIRHVVKEDPGVDRNLHPEVEITVENEHFSDFRFEENGGISFVVEDYSTAEPQRTEYVFDPNGKNSEKKFVKIGNQWIPPYLEGNDLDGSKRISIQQAARKLDECRYKLSERISLLQSHDQKT